MCNATTESRSSTNTRALLLSYSSKLVEVTKNSGGASTASIGRVPVVGDGVPVRQTGAAVVVDKSGLWRV